MATKTTVIRATILLVEDQSDILLILRRILHADFPKYNITTMTNGADALTFATHTPLAVVITDFHMPQMDGLQLTEALRQTDADVPIVLVTAYASPELERRAKAAGVTAFVSKPFSVISLLALVASLIPQEPA